MRTDRYFMWNGYEEAYDYLHSKECPFYKKYIDHYLGNVNGNKVDIRMEGFSEVYMQKDVVLLESIPIYDFMTKFDIIKSIDSIPPRLIAEDDRHTGALRVLNKLLHGTHFILNGSILESVEFKLSTPTLIADLYYDFETYNNQIGLYLYILSGYILSGFLVVTVRERTGISGQGQIYYHYYFLSRSSASSVTKTTDVMLSRPDSKLYNIRNGYPAYTRIPVYTNRF